MNSPFGSTCPYPLTVPPVLSHDMDELHQMYTDLILGMELAVPGTGPDTWVTLSRSRYDLIKGLFPVEWSLGVAKIGGGHYQYPHDVDDVERAFLFAREAIVKERPGVIVLGPLTEEGDVLANCEYSNFVEMLIQSAREARPETRVVWDETLGGFGRIAGARPQLWSTEFFLKAITPDATIIPSVYGLDAALVGCVVNQEGSADNEGALNDDDELPSVIDLNREVNGLRDLVTSGLSLPTASAYIGSYIYNKLWNELIGRSRVVVDVHHRGCWIAIEVLHDELRSDKLPACTRLISRSDHDVLLVCPPFAYEDPQTALPHADELVQCMLDLFLHTE
ncbi:hypothetical protein Pmar_PMAR006378 [Perkinsus marinus ATCC 50983]|uniref:Uncharacterized protein n=1 Tax=Perkinsus marinus (strain ATCC 50983 / TXsc) TaxID=423536 RepID=C5K9I6_PERM5|nr:hypothetical protein Pmar_PMAR006378 [Perkinsus marinus ATCC 50983]EER18758.1 hypothetical protein Pmar_PMAR006378 [Perkinsus marinus ATCC 50983]|eukprot:XP_002786962.1 hypothetical protein Pmar_PMAR006378 [Perkinsus marinus ATCC 50983]